MTQVKKLSKFSMPVLRRRAKKMVRKKFKKTIKLSDLDKIWGEYVEYGIIKPLLRLGKAEVSDRFNIEIVGTKIIESKNIMGTVLSGYNVSRNGLIKPAIKFDKNRDDVVYNIVLTDKNYNGKLFFKPDAKLAARVHNELKTTKTYYRIQ